MKRAGSRIRTDDLLITNQLLYQLSYAGDASEDTSRLVALIKCSLSGKVQRRRSAKP